MNLWRYEKDGKPSDLLDHDAFAKLVREGVVGPDTLVWQRGMERWESFSRHRDAILGAAHVDSADHGAARCAHCGEPAATVDLLPYGEVRISADHKDAFIQEALETARTGLRSPDEGPLVYVGFWWRGLARLIDSFALMLPSYLFQLPFYFLLYRRTGNLFTPAQSWTWDIWTAYAGGIIGGTLVAVAYEVWMVLAYQATLGKIAIGAIVVTPDGGRLSFMRALGRWLARDLLCMIITLLVMSLVAGIIGLIVGVFSGGNPTVLVAAVFIGVAIGTLLGSFPFAMAGWDPQKRALHDRVSSTRVVKKNR